VTFLFVGMSKQMNIVLCEFAYFLKPQRFKANHLTNWRFVAMTSLFFMRFIKTVMVTMPFLIMILMVLALWGVGGKTTYADLNATKQQMEFGAGEAKNYLVKGTKNHDLNSTELENPEISVEVEKCTTTKKDPLPEKIEWELVV
jgi:hypothetical protein